MKKILLITTLILSAPHIKACDICGCSAGNYFIGLFPQFRKHFIGLRYSFRSFHSSVAGDASQFSRDFYQTTELWGGFNIGKKWQLIGFIPYNINTQNSDDGKSHRNGLGDISFIANYRLLDRSRRDAKGNRISQQLWIGGGLKLPTGKFSADPDDIIAGANNQPGTGSADLILNAMYSLHINEWGINTNANYRINQSAKDFRFGNRFSSSAFVFHSMILAKKDFIPNAGVLYENLQANKLSSVKIEQTGGNALLAAVGADISLGKVSTGFNVQLPLHQDLSAGQTTAKVRGMLHITLAF